jgi:hypothetical protein
MHKNSRREGGAKFSADPLPIRVCRTKIPLFRGSLEVNQFVDFT